MKTLKLFILIILLPSCFVAQVHEEKFTELKKKLESLSSDEIELRYAYIDTGLILSRKINDQKRVASFLRKKGNLFVRTNPDLAMSCYYEALNISKNLKDKKGVATSLANIGSFANLKASDKLAYLYKARSLYREMKDTIALIQVYNNIGSFLLDIHDSPDSATSYFQKAKMLSEKKDYLNGIALSNLNLGVISYIRRKNYKKALKYLYLAKSQVPEDDISHLGIEANIMNAYFEMNEPDSAMHYYNLLQKNLHLRPDLQAKCYASLSGYYARSQNLSRALKYDEKADSVKEFIRARNNENQLKLLELEHESNLKKNEIDQLHAQTEKDRIIRIFLIAIFLVLLILSGSIVLWLREKNKSSRERRLRAESDLKNSELQKRILNDELKFTNKELSSFAAGIVKNTDHLNDIKKQISLALEEKNPQKSREKLRELNMTINQLFHKDQERKEFIKRTRQVNHSLIFFLKSQYPYLNDNDINLLVLMMLKFTSKEISSLYNMEVTSVGTKRSRLRKKMGLKDRENFDDFMDELIKDFKAVH